MNKPYKIGIAGYMGAGKSVCAHILAEALAPDIEVIDADAEAKHLMQSDPVLIRALVDAFGVSVFNGTILDFAALGAAAFAGKHNLDLLNSIVHPKVITLIEKRLMDTRHTYCICDAALIPLWNIENRFDMLIWISSSQEIRYARLAEKLRLSETLLRKRMELQETIMREPARLPWRIITNNGTDIGLFTETLVPHIREIQMGLPA